MDYFDKQDSNKAAQQQEKYNHNQPQEQPAYHIQAKNVFPDNWKVPQDGDFDFVSYSWTRFEIAFHGPHTWIYHRNYNEVIIFAKITINLNFSYISYLLQHIWAINKQDLWSDFSV